MVVADTSVWVDLFNGNSTPNVKKLIQASAEGQLIMLDLILMEILQGFKSDRDYQLAKFELTKLKCATTINGSLAIKSADNYRFLRKQGVTIRKSIDCIIATFCIHSKCSLITNDKDFTPFQEHLELRLV